MESGGVAACLRAFPRVQLSSSICRDVQPVISVHFSQHLISSTITTAALSIGPTSALRHTSLATRDTSFDGLIGCAFVVTLGIIYWASMLALTR